MEYPSFCPNRHCPYHHSLPSELSLRSNTEVLSSGLSARKGHGRWFTFDGCYTTKVAGRVQRYRCRFCGTTFSDQTFSLDYYSKKHLSYRTIFDHIVDGSGVRMIGRKFGFSHQVITNRLSRLARQAIAVQSEVMENFKLSEHLVADGFESFVESQYEPNNIHLLVGKESQFLYAFDYAHLRRKGRMTAYQKSERERREKLYIRRKISISESFAQIVETIEKLVRASLQEAIDAVDQKKQFFLYTDEKREYVREVLHSEFLRDLIRKGMFAHFRISSRKERTVTNPLFGVNYWDRELRKDNANHVRETVQFSRDVHNCLERIAIYQMYHNYFKPYRINQQKSLKLSHAEVAGIKSRKIQETLDKVFEQRKFFSRICPEWSQVLIWFRMVGNCCRYSGGYLPSYVWM